MPALSLREDALQRAQKKNPPGQYHQQQWNEGGPFSHFAAAEESQFITGGADGIPLQRQLNPLMAYTTIQRGATQGSNVVKDARSEWRLHGHAVTQVLEEQRHAALYVRVTEAVERVDVAGATYVAYLLQVVNKHQHDGSTWTEHRYSDFEKLFRLLQQEKIEATHRFPPKQSWPNWQKGNKTHNDELVNFRLVQLDAWLVDIVTNFFSPNPDVSGNVEMSPRAYQALREFLLAPPQRPCDQENNLIQNTKPSEAIKWNNPLATTLGSAIRQATWTVRYMCGVQPETGKALQWGDSDQTIPLDLLQAAQGLCFLTVLKAGVVVSGRLGTGLVVSRLPGTQGNVPQWSAPCAMGTLGMGWGAQIGSDVTHYLIVLTSREAVLDLVSSSSDSTAVQLGAEVGVAVGPLGRVAQSSLQTGGNSWWKPHAAYAYAHSQGLFVGMSLEGSLVRVRDDVNGVFYGQACNPEDLLEQPGPKAAEPLYKAINMALQTPVKPGGMRPLTGERNPNRASASDSWKGTPSTATTTPGL